MSKTKNDEANWIVSNYDKVALLAVLIMILGTAGLLTFKTGNFKDQISTTSSSIRNTGESAVTLDTGAIARVFETLASPVEIGSDHRRLLVGPLRVECVSSREPIAYEATVCPFCKTAQPTNSIPVDSDGDTMADKWEKLHGLNPLDPSDAWGDLDGDKFNNMDEFSAKTDPRDAASKPDPLSKMRHTKIVVVPFKLRFLGVSKLPNGENSYQLNVRTLDRTYFVTNGGVLEGWRILGFDNKDPKKPALLLKHAERSKRLVQNEVIDDDSYAVTLISLIEKKAVAVVINQTVTIAGDEYNVVDINQNLVVIRNTTTGREARLNKLTTEEADTLRGERGNRPESPRREGVRDFGGSNPTPLDDVPTR